MSGIIGINPARSTGELGSHDIRTGHSCAIRLSTGADFSSGAQRYPFKARGVTTIHNMDTSLFTPDTANDYGLTINYTGFYDVKMHIYRTTPTQQSYLQYTISVWDGSNYLTALSDWYGIFYSYHSGGSQWQTHQTGTIGHLTKGRTYGVALEIQSGNMTINSTTKLIITYLGS